ncbi:MAG: outer membrane lipoprotein-sorting protein [Saprospiraceae bacterium]|nr:outer membrane lipoprotein-sorting protein [Saprospiraceae bacterium]
MFASGLAAQSAKDIVRKADEHARGKTSMAHMTIQTIRPKWSREMTMKTWGKGNDLAMILITAPVKDKGIVFLKRKKEVWNWIPSIERNIKMPPSMMSQSWMGTDFTNDDLVKEASILEDYEHTLVKDSLIDDRICYKIHLQPKPQAAVIWGGIDLFIDKKNDVILHAHYFDEEGRLVNTMHASGLKNLGGRLLPARLEMIPADKKGHKTVLIYNSLTFDKAIEDAFFTSQNMSKLQ